MNSFRYGALLDAVRGMTWPSRRRAIGVLPGTHPSRRRGAAPEFSEYRAYRQGDDPRQLDWKLLARTNRAFVRLADERAILPTFIVVDASSSMRFPVGDAGKWELACAVTVALASVAHAAGDPVGLIVPTSQGEIMLPARTRRGAVHEIARALGSATASAEVALAPALARVRPAARVVIVSDFLGDADAMRRAAQALVAAGSDVQAIHVVAREELELASGAALYSDPEAPELVRPYDPESCEEYSAAFAAWREGIARSWRLAGATYTLVTTTENAAHAVGRIVHDASAARA